MRYVLYYESGRVQYAVWVWLSLAVLVPAGRLVKGSGSGDMDRTYWINSNELLVGETVVSQQSGVRLYDGEDRVSVK